MPWIDGWQSTNMLRYLTPYRVPQPANRGIDAAEQRSVGLGAAPNGLIEVLVSGLMQAPEALRQYRQIAASIGNVVNADQSRIAEQPLISRVAKLPPCERKIGPEMLVAGPVDICLEPGCGDIGPRGAQQVSSMVHRHHGIVISPECIE